MAQEFVVAAGGGFGQVVTYRPGLVGNGPAATESPASTPALTPTPTPTPTPMTLSLGGVWGGFGGPATPNENADEINAASANALDLGGLGVRTQEGAEIVDGSSYVVACPRAEDATPVARPAGLVFGLERAG